jgi:urea transporter
MSIVIEKPTEIASTVINQMSLFNHEQVVFCNDNETGLKAIIAILVLLAIAVLTYETDV